MSTAIRRDASCHEKDLITMYSYKKIEDSVFLLFLLGVVLILQNYSEERVYNRSFTLLFIYRFQDPFIVTNTSGLKYSRKSDMLTGAVPKLRNFFFHVIHTAANFWQIWSKLWSGIDGIKSIIFISQILGDVPSCGDVLLTVFREKTKTLIKIWYLALKNSLFLVSTRNDNISRGWEAKMEFPEGRGGLSWEPILENSQGGRGHRKNPFRGERMDIFWNYTINFLWCILSHCFSIY